MRDTITHAGSSDDRRFFGGKSGLHRAGCRITSGRSNLRDSATENIQPVHAGNGEMVQVRAHQVCRKSYALQAPSEASSNREY